MNSQGTRGRGGTASRPEFAKEAQRGDVPLARFGHTTTPVGGGRVVLFGGATGDSGRYTITADAYSLDTNTDTWVKITAEGAAPTARAAHAAACVDQSQMVIYGGATGGGSLSSDDLHLLDTRQEDQAQWMSVPVLGSTPGRRYGHSMVFSKPSLIVFGGNSGQTAESDIWVLDVEQSPFQWSEVTVMHTRVPLPRVYHSADMCREGPAAGMMVVFGGRTPDNRSLRDTWGLRQHRDGRWDWVEAPTKRGQPPEPRFQHDCLFVGSKLVVVGGRGSDVNKQLPTSVYDTETCEWRDIVSVNRFRHSSWGQGNLVFAHGGFDHRSPSAPTEDLQVLDLDRGISAGVAAGTGTAAEDVGGDDSAVAQSFSSGQPQRRGSGFDGTAGQQSRGGEPPRPATPPRVRAGQPDRSDRAAIDAARADVKISHQVAVCVEKETGHTLQQVSIASLEEEGRKIHSSKVMANVAGQSEVSSVASITLEHLLQPTTWQPDPDPNKFLLHAMEVSQLCDQVLELLMEQPMVIRLRAPIKVYGDIHGQYLDLMRLFARYKAPTDGHLGDIDSMDYLFLGDYVDRGSFNLETICVLFALKVKYPTQIHLIRGNHEDPTINAIYGFHEECRRRLQEDPDNPDSCWSKFNKCFEWLPLGAVIEDRILCLHGGIGGELRSIADIDALQRPLKVAQMPETAVEQRVTDILWSDPSDSDSMQGVTANETRDPDGSGRIVKYGPDRVEQFLNDNKPLSMIIRAHECVMDGFERFANGKLITVFSATDYCGHHKNAGALLFVRRDLTIVPKLIYPVERTDNTWDPVISNQRPPTPPRAVARRGDREWE